MKVYLQVDFNPEDVNELLKFRREISDALGQRAWSIGADSSGHRVLFVLDSMERAQEAKKSIDSLLEGAPVEGSCELIVRESALKL